MAEVPSNLKQFQRLIQQEIFVFPTRQELQACWELCRLSRNLGFWVSWLPVAWSIAMVYHAQPGISASAALSRAGLYIPLCFGLKSLVMTIDDILDADIDEKVPRTRNRALPRKAISRVRAWLFFFLQVVIGVYSALTILRPATLRVSMMVWPMYIIYPTCKRWTYFAPVMLGLMLKIGALMGWIDLTMDNQIPWVTLIALYFGACLWTIVYETIYQYQDKAEDIALGLYSMAILFGKMTIPICVMATFGFMGSFYFAGVSNGQGYAFYIGITCAGGLQLARLLKTDIEKPGDCEKVFRGTPLIGQIILGGLVIDAVLQRVVNGIPL
ncbi:4-hydroxybenzoate polyprenyltransferase, mitochondrial [Hypsizygus marmoreus]|uniref:4-hydroxybenzoate polyprenyltransferase, mitochondrial n=1 Tax=Hypsizygus marmoreus TaxID=39966 RepID=A0A369JGH7_HYPMA|nr:4-hydroxybenzoate polyprenyltransferase, mitochondrial [Hypsizygus marmoreus]